MAKIWAKIEKTSFFVGLWLGLGQKYRKNYLLSKGLVKKRAKIEKNTLLGRALVRVRAKNEKKNQHTFWYGLG